MRKQLFFVIALWASVSLIAQTEIPMDSAIRYGKLDNGLTYYIRHNEEPAERADFYIVQNVGAILEEDNQNGLAHFLEHMAFNGTKNFPGKTIIDYMETIGVKFGANLNAYTSLDETVYLLKNIPTVRQSIVDSTIWILHDWSGFISLDDDEIDKERGVILEEWRTRGTADRRIWKESNRLKYPGSQYAKRDVIGDTAIINNFKYDELRAYYHKWYRPDQQALIIVGDINVDAVEATIKRLFADIPKLINPAKRIIYDIPDNTEPIVAIVTDSEAKYAIIEVNYKHRPVPDSIRITTKGYDKDLVNSLISSMLSDRFDYLLMDKNCPFVQAVGYYGDITRSCDAFQVAVVAKEGKGKMSFEALLKEVERVKRYGFTQPEFDRAKVKLLASFEKSYNERNKQKNASLVQEYIRNFLEAEPIPGIEWEYEYAQKALSGIIDLNMVNQTVQSYITSNNVIVSISAPEKMKQTLPSETEVRSMLTASTQNIIDTYSEKKVEKPLLSKKIKAGKVVKEYPYILKGTTEWVLDNGIRVLIKPTDFKNDEVLFFAFSEGGISLVDKIDDLPSAMLTDEFIARNGVGNLSYLELNRILAGKIVSISTNIGTYEESMKGGSSVKDLETLFQLIYLKFTAPRKDNKAFLVFKQSLQTMYANKQTDPNAAFNDTISAIMSNYSPRNVIMNLATLEKVTQNKVYKTYKERFKNPADFTFVFIGNINPDSMKPLVENYLGGMKTTVERESWRDNNVRIPSGKIKKEFEQPMQVEKTSVYIVNSGNMIYDWKNKITLSMLSDILDIRYTESIRENEGGSYGVRTSSNVTNRPQEQAALTIRFDTDPQKGERLIAIAQKELENIRENGPRNEDLEKVKQNLLKKYKEDQKENTWWRSAIFAYERDGFNLSTQYESIVNEITADDIKQILQALMVQNNSIEFIMNPKK